jgi:hypothetical protein
MSVQIARNGHANRTNLQSRLLLSAEAMLYPQVSKWSMREEILDSYIRQYLEAHDTPVISFAWRPASASRGGAFSAVG